MLSFYYDKELNKDQDPPHWPCAFLRSTSIAIFSVQMSSFLLLSHPGFSNGRLGTAAEYKRVIHSEALCGLIEVVERSLI